MVVDHPGSSGRSDQHERSHELDDHPDPQRPLPERVFLEPDQVAAPQRRRVVGILIGRDISHGSSALASCPVRY